MFIWPINICKNGKRHAYWTLVQSYRTERGPRQRVVVYLGKLDEAGRLGIKQTADEDQLDTQRKLPQQKLFPESEEQTEPQWIEIDAKAVRMENCRRFGDVWLALESFTLHKSDQGSFPQVDGLLHTKSYETCFPHE